MVLMQSTNLAFKFFHEPLKSSYSHISLPKITPINKL